MTRNKWWGWILFLFLLVLAVALGRNFGLIGAKETKSSSGQSSIVINGHRLSVEIADTPEKRTKGLSGRKSMSQNQGMLFVFPQPDVYPFWMKEMKFNLDFVFINGDRVVEVVEDVPFPQSGEEPARIRPKEKADKILEINAGVIRKLGIEVGDEVVFSNL